MLRGVSTAGTDFAACTVASRRYLAQARVLAQSFREHHPGGRFVVFIPDDPDRERSVGEGVEELRPADIGLDDEEFHRMALSYTVKQLSCAMKVFVFEHLVRRGDTTILLDGDIDVHSDLSPLAELADRHGLVLTPHATAPAAPPQHYPPLPWRAPRMRNAVGPEQMAIHSGAFNGGVMAASGNALPFLEWWRERVARYCLLDVELGLFQEQGWIALAPALFDCHVLREPGWNVSAFELHDTDVSWDSGRPEIRGAPLRCFHYITFDPAFPGEFTRLIQLANVFPPGAERPGAMRVCRDYADQLLAAGHEEAQADVSPFDLLADGTPIDLNMRTAYAEALLEHEAGRGPEPPNPLRSGDVDAWMEWLSEPVEGPVGSLPVSRYLLGMHTRERWAYEPHREVPGADSRAFLDWIAYGGREGYFEVGERWLPPPPAPRVDPAVAALEERNAELERRIAYYTGTLSWRITAPLRRAAAAVRAWRRTA
jgi:hypothetical protein